MLDRIVPQVEPEVKCADEYCGEAVYSGGLCFDHFVAEQTATWNDQDAERQIALEGVGYVFGDPVGEVCR